MLSDQEIAELKSTHGRIAHVVGKGNAWEVVFRKPTRAEYKKFKADAANPARQSDAQEMLARSIVVHPSREAFDALLEDYPAIPEASSSAIAELVGFGTEEAGK